MDLVSWSFDKEFQWLADIFISGEDSSTKKAQKCSNYFL